MAADENDEVLKAIKEAASGIKEVSSYSKQLAEAIQSAVRPMQQINDLAKAIKEQNIENNKANKEMSENITKSLQTTKDLSDQIKMNAEQLKEIVASRREMLITEQQIMEIEKQAAQIQMENHQRSSEMSKSNYEKGRRTMEHNRALEEQKSIFTQLAREAERYYDKATLASGVVRGMSTMGGTASHIFTGKDTFTAGMANIGSSLSSLIPAVGGIGGLIGLMLAGKMKEAEFQAVGQSAAQVFDQVGGHTQQFASRMGSAARELSVRSMAAKEDLHAVAAGFAQTGVSANQATQKIEGFKSIVGGDLIVATLAADKALELPAGTFAKMSGTLATNFNTSAKEAFVNLMNIGQAAKEAGLNAATFMQQTMEASSALRLLNANGQAVGQMQLDFAKKMKDSGMGAQFSGAYAAAGMQSAMQSISGLGVGMSAVVGERMGLGGGLDAWYAMKSGQAQARDGKQLDPGAVAAELAKMARDTGKTRAEQVYFLSQLTGTSVGGSEAILDAGKEYQANGQLSKSSQRTLNTAFQSESEKTSDIIRNLELIKDGILHVGTGMLSIVISVLKMIFHGIQAIAGILGGDRDKFKAYTELIGDDQVGLTKGIDKVGAGIQQIGEGVAGEFDSFGLRGGWFPGQKVEKTAAERQAAFEEWEQWKIEHDKEAGPAKKTKYIDGEDAYDISIKHRKSKGKRYKQTGGQ